MLSSKLVINLELYKFMGINTIIPIQYVLFLRNVLNVSTDVLLTQYSDLTSHTLWQGGGKKI